MRYKIYWQDLWTEDFPNIGPDKKDIYAGLSKLMHKVSHADVAVNIGYLDRSTYLTDFAYLELVNNVEIIKGLRLAEQDGYDATIIGCGNDPALQAAREALRIPVIGITESAMLIATTLGSKFAALGLTSKCIPLVERNLKLSGLESRAITNRPIRSIDFSDNIPKWFSSKEYALEHLVPRFESVARACIEDGAEVIITSCAFLSALSLAGYTHIEDTEVPIVDCVVAGLKMAETMAFFNTGMGVSTSKHHTYSSLPAEQLDSLTAPFG